MPEICRFLGITIYMLYNDHRPPHFHARYGEYRIRVGIDSYDNATSATEDTESTETGGRIGQ